MRLTVPRNGFCSYTDDQKNKISEKCAARINDDGYLIVTSQSERTQLANKENSIHKFESIIAKALTPS